MLDSSMQRATRPQKAQKVLWQAGLAFPHSVGLRTQTGLAWKYPTRIGKPLTQSQPSLTQSKIGVTQPSSTGLGLDPGLIASSKQALSTTYLICKGLWGQGLMGAQFIIWAAKQPSMMNQDHPSRLHDPIPQTLVSGPSAGTWCRGSRRHGRVRLERV